MNDERPCHSEDEEKTMRLSATCEPAKNRREKRRKEDERIKRSNGDDNDDDAGRDSKGENKGEIGGKTIVARRSLNRTNCCSVAQQEDEEWCEMVEGGLTIRGRRRRRRGSGLYRSTRRIRLTW